MTQWMSGTFLLGAMLLALTALSQWPTLADAGSEHALPPGQQASAGAAPPHLGWMMEQHWHVVNGQ